MTEYTTIRVTVEERKRLANYNEWGENVNDTIMKVLDFYEENSEAE